MCVQFASEAQECFVGLAPQVVQNFESVNTNIKHDKSYASVPQRIQVSGVT